MKTLDVALAYAAETGRPVFPCLANKRPTRVPGFHAATSDPDAIRALWQSAPGPLIGMPTGAASGVAALDIDATKHPPAGKWFDENYSRLGETLTIETRSGGWHCYYQHPPGQSCRVKLFGIEGVDVRADGGYVIAWGLQGCRTLTDAPPAPWPKWLTPSRPPRPDRAATMPPRVTSDAAVDRVIRFASNATEGERNSRLFWAACRLGEMQMAPQRAVALTVAIGTRLGLDHREAERTALSALRRVRQ